MKIDGSEIYFLGGAQGVFKSFASFLTISIAILLYDKFGVDRNLKFKQIESVIAFLKVFRSLKFKIVTELIPPYYTSVHVHYANGLDESIFFEDHLTTPVTTIDLSELLVVPSSNLKELFSNEIYLAAESIYLPMKIRNELNSLRQIIKPVIPGDKIDLRKCIVIMNIGDDEEKSKMFLSPLVKEPMLFKEYLLKLAKIEKACNDFLQSHSDIVEDLNI